MEDLANCDPDMNVSVLCSYQDWSYSDVDECSTEYTAVEWTTDFQLVTQQEGSVKLGVCLDIEDII